MLASKEYRDLDRLLEKAISLLPDEKSLQIDLEELNLHRNLLKLRIKVLCLIGKAEKLERN